MTHLFIVAHPDDEILGSCGTIRKLVLQGERVAVATFSSSSKTREEGLSDKQKATHEKIGVKASYFYDYEMMRFDKYERYQMTKEVENVIIKEQPDVIYTHDINDIHNDHRFLHQIVMEAAKLPLRGIGYKKPIRAIYTMEIPSSTDWGMGFMPNSFVEISEESLQAKEHLIRAYYEGVARDIPHPRNLESFKSLARYRGGQCGCQYAEAYKKLFEVT